MARHGTRTALLTLALLALGALFATDARAASVQPVVIAGAANVACSDLDDTYAAEGTTWQELKFDSKDLPSVGASTTLGTAYLSVTITRTGTDTWSWTSTKGIDAVLVKSGASGHNLYVYDPDPPEALSDTGLVVVGQNGTSHLSFCYDINLDVTKTAVPTFTRDWAWTIEKTGDKAGTAGTPYVLSAGQSWLVNYAVKLDAVASESAFAVRGAIEIANPAAVPATIVSIADEITGSVTKSVTVSSCYPKGDPKSPVALPAQLAAGQTLVCDYATTFATKPSGTLTNTATVTSTGVPGGTGQATFAFTAPTTTTDECVEVTDDRAAGDPWAVCAGDADKTIEYAIDVGRALEKTCGPETYRNVASSRTTGSGAGDETDDSGSDDHVVYVTVDCESQGGDGCTLSQGYWKTHSKYGPAPTDSRWNLVQPAGADTAFFATGKSWYEILWLPPKGGNAYLVLAHQWAAAKLNVLTGASTTPAVDTALADAAALLQQYGTGNAVPAPNVVPTDVRARMLSLASTLEQYNTGAIGPGHCSEDASSKTKAVKASSSTEPKGKGRITICHKGRTITIARAAWAAHRRHGDVEGACTGASAKGKKADAAAKKPETAGQGRGNGKAPDETPAPVATDDGTGKGKGAENGNGGNGKGKGSRS
ncbi:MAG: hypothetical protein FJW96_12165 [Actinobacteria bacterium]|nr:hypothetical protein [Actinomycetota bacterium]